MHGRLQICSSLMIPQCTDIVLFGSEMVAHEQYAPQFSFCPWHVWWQLTVAFVASGRSGYYSVCGGFAGGGCHVWAPCTDEEGDMALVWTKIGAAIFKVSGWQCYHDDPLRFLPSDFGVEEDRINPLRPFQAFLDKKRRIRRAINANCFGAYFVNFLLHPYGKEEHISVYGNGETKAILNYEEDIAWYTIKVATDPRTANRIVIYRPSKNIISQNQLISLWERKTCQNFHKIFVPDEEIVKLSQTLPSPQNIPVSILHSIFVRGDLVNFELGEDDLEASQLYPDYNYTSIDQLVDKFLVDPPAPARAAFE